ncbi:hypothetical protein XENOCAPTIV_014156 [Xenoophorus captivus]|uniref:Uncharacterized protein n=1 Tax=Xenoophorus captivus TaxID=1517983 RepID=A0ABV0RQQ8_9TELE
MMLSCFLEKQLSPRKSSFTEGDFIKDCMMKTVERKSPEKKQEFVSVCDAVDDMKPAWMAPCYGWRVDYQLWSVIKSAKEEAKLENSTVLFTSKFSVPNI